MKKGADALKGIHSNLYVKARLFVFNLALTSNADTIFQLSYFYSTAEGVDATMDKIREQMDLTNEISDAISNPVGMGIVLDEVSEHILDHSHPQQSSYRSLKNQVNEADILFDHYRTTSKKNSKLWNKNNWMTDLLVQIEYQVIFQHRQSDKLQDVSSYI